MWINKIDFCQQQKMRWNKRGWDDLMLFNNRDTYMNSPFMGICSCWKNFERCCFKVWNYLGNYVNSDVDVKRLGSQNYFGELVVEYWFYGFKLCTTKSLKWWWLLHTRWKKNNRPDQLLSLYKSYEDILKIQFQLFWEGIKQV